VQKLGIFDPQKLRMCGQQKYNCKNCVSILYSENLVPQKFTCIQFLRLYKVATRLLIKIIKLDIIPYIKGL